MKIAVDSIEDIVLHQLESHWTKIDEEAIIYAVPLALKAIEDNYKGMPNKRLWDGEDVVFSPYISVQWMNFLYRLSHTLYTKMGKVLRRIRYIT